MTVQTQWDRITAWCAANAPATARAFRPGADPADVDAAEEASEQTWPDQLRELFALVDGAPNWDQDGVGYLGQLLPDKVLLSLEEAAELRQMMLEVWAELADDDPDIIDDADADNAPACTPAYRFLPSYIPFASLDDYHLFVDTRPGPASGCVAEYAHESADGGGPLYPSVAAFLGALADALEGGSAFGYWVPSAQDGKLTWTFAG